MTLLDERARQVDPADLIILAHVETIRDQMQPATASAVASMIGGAPRAAIYKRLEKMRRLQVVEDVDRGAQGWQLTPMGAELLARELVGWSPSVREQRRRDALLRSAAAGAMRSG